MAVASEVAKMLPNRIVRFLNFFDAFGFNSGASKLSNHRTVIGLIQILHVVIVVLLTFFQFRLIFFILTPFGIADVMNETVQYSALLYTYWLIIVDSLLQHRSHMRFWAIVEEINRNFCGQLKCYRNYTIKLIEFHTLLAFVSLITWSSNDWTMFDAGLAYSVLIKIVHIRMFYYIFCLDTVNFQLEMIECGVKSQRLKRTREYIYNTHEMVDILNEIFGWSQVAAIPCCFYLLTTDINWVYAHGHEISNAVVMC